MTWPSGSLGGSSTYSSNAFQNGRTASMSTASIATSTPSADQGSAVSPASAAIAEMVVARSTSASVRLLVACVVSETYTHPGYRTSMSG